MPVNPPSKHHYIPEFYLKRWAGSDGRMVRYTSPVPGKIVARRCFPSEVGFRADLYRAPIDDPIAAQQLEASFFSKLDNMSAKALDNLLVSDRRTLHRESVDVFCVFIFALLHRTPFYFDALIRGGTRIFERTILGLEHRYDELRAPDHPPTFREFVATIDEADPERKTLEVIPRLVVNSNILKFLRGMHWAVLVMKDLWPNLLLSDDPLVRTNGLRNDGGHVAIPLSPNHLMIGAWQVEKISEFRRSDPLFLVKQVNKQTVETAREFVVATDERQRCFVENRFGKNPRPPLIAAD